MTNNQQNKKLLEMQILKPHSKIVLVDYLLITLIRKVKDRKIIILGKFQIRIVPGMYHTNLKVDFKLAVDQQTKAHDRTSEAVPDSPVPAGKLRPYVVNFWLNFATSP